MTSTELKFYEAGIKDANEARHITVFARSERAMQLHKEHTTGVIGESIKYIDAYNSGVAYEINRQTRLEF